jgi:hypothetical protein
MQEPGCGSTGGNPDVMNSERAHEFSLDQVDCRPLLVERD